MYRSSLWQKSISAETRHEPRRMNKISKWQMSLHVMRPKYPDIETTLTTWLNHVIVAELNATGPFYVNKSNIRAEITSRRHKMTKICSHTYKDRSTTWCYKLMRFDKWTRLPEVIIWTNMYNVMDNLKINRQTVLTPCAERKSLTSLLVGSVWNFL